MEEDLEVLSGSNDDEEQICPLCMELLDETDRNLFPCSCGYQVCLWCLHYIRNTMGNKCPACRQDYEESNFKYKTKTPTSTRTLQTKKKRESKDSLSKDSLNDSSKDSGKDEPKDPKDLKEDQVESLKDVRVIQRNLVYVVGIPLKLAKKEILKKYEYFGQYGKIQHIVVNKSNTYSSNWGGPSYTAYITYSKKSEASCAIQGINGQQIDNKYLRASYGTTKYCSYFLKGLKCFNSDCFYLHQFGDERDRFVKDSSKLLYNTNSFNKDLGSFSSVNREQSMTSFSREQPGGSMTRESRDVTDGTWVSVVSGAKPQTVHTGFTSHLQQASAASSTENTTSNITANLTANIASIASNLTNITANLTWNSHSNAGEGGLFSMPISQCLERYNKCNRLVNLRNINSDKLNSVDTVKKLIEWSHVNPSQDFNTNAKDSAATKINTDKELSGYVNKDNAGKETSESTNADSSSSDTRDGDKETKHSFVPDELTVNDIMSRIRRHTMLIDNLSKQYSNLNHTSSTSVAQSNFNGNLSGIAKDSIGLGYNRDFSGFNNIESYAINVLHNHAPTQSYTNNFTNYNVNKEASKDREKDAGKSDEVDKKLELEAFKILQVQLQRNEQFANHMKLIVEQ
ncbi:RING-type E3 ubiquitin transferase [Theileria orientalis]|uniref:RING-type E3 ubiquitin transferase n=1 Tax=Theileria orientalis TaxID=68886 RepID=A0A976QTW1_THEOR|nr:RING-type E3 ubiquitin transferase [Theileria orientalis]